MLPLCLRGGGYLKNRTFFAASLTIYILNENIPPKVTFAQKEEIEKKNLASPCNFWKFKKKSLRNLLFVAFKLRNDLNIKY